MELKENRLEFVPKVKISVVEATPTLSPEQFSIMTRNVDAVIFIVFAIGTSPERLNNIIRQRMEQNIPIFLVSKNPGDGHGILKIAYDVQVQSLKAGAFPLQKVNVNNINEISIAIQEEFSKGKKGIELGKVIQDRFSYKEGEKMPTPDWENPVEIAKQRSLYKNTLQRMNLPEKEIEEELRKWEGSV